MLPGRPSNGFVYGMFGHDMYVIKADCNKGKSIFQPELHIIKKKKNRLESSLHSENKYLDPIIIIGIKFSSRHTYQVSGTNVFYPNMRYKIVHEFFSR